MPNESSDRVALVTGTRKGIGRFLAEHLLRSGFLVVGCSRQRADWSAPGYTHQITDVTSESEVKTLLGLVQDQFGRLDVAINNAGTASMNAALLTPVAKVNEILATNVHGTALVSRESAKLMMRRKRGRIVNFGSIAVSMRIEGEAIYAASKAAVASYSRILARELAPFGITVNVVAPGPIDTDLLRGVPQDKLQGIVERQAIKRMGRMEDIANVVDFFIRPESDFITGQVLYLGGG
jgi:3-oxoacyl-[acyl-carrier protein] reductase